MAEILRLFVSATTDLEAQRSVIGRCVAELPTRIGIEIRRTPVRNTLGITPDSELENRRYLQQQEGKVSIPYLYDPNTEQGLFESKAILRYLGETYGA